MIRGKKILGIVIFGLSLKTVRPITLPNMAVRSTAAAVAIAAGFIAKATFMEWKDNEPKTNIFLRTPATLAFAGLAFIITDGYLANFTTEGRLAIANLMVQDLYKQIAQNQLLLTNCSTIEDIENYIATSMINKRLPLAELAAQLHVLLTNSNKINNILTVVLNNATDSDIYDEATAIKGQVETIRANALSVLALLEKMPTFKQQCSAFSAINGCTGHGRC